MEALGTASVMTSSFTIVGLCFPGRIATVYVCNSFNDIYILGALFTGVSMFLVTQFAIVTVSVALMKADWTFFRFLGKMR